MAEIFPRRWKVSTLFGEDSLPWSELELRKASEQLLIAAERSFKLCLFIDGLDEYNGNHSALVDIIEQMISKANVKICLSSRLWPVFEDAFSQQPSLMLQDLTYPDIVRFTTESLHGSRGFKNLQQREPNFAAVLIDNIAKKSKGVFLWVALTVKSLLHGLSNCDRISDLQKRLQTIPGDLELLYEKIFDSFDPFYAEHSSQLLQITKEGQGMLSTLRFSFADEEDETLALSQSCTPVSDGDKATRYETMKRRLASRCKGFLEIPATMPYSITTDNESPQRNLVNDSSVEVSGNLDSLSTDGEHTSIGYDCTSAQRNSLDNRFAELSVTDTENEAEEARRDEHNTRNFASTQVRSEVYEPCPLHNGYGADLKVAYLHRTARDFLESPRIQSALRSATKDSFKPAFSLLRSSILVLKTLPDMRLTRSVLWECIDQCMKEAATVEVIERKAPSDLLDEIDKAAEKLYRRAKLTDVNHWTTIYTPQGGEPGFFALAAKYNLQLYLRENIDNGLPVFTRNPARPLLDYVVVDYALYTALCEPKTDLAIHDSPVPSIALIRHLLANGADPNQPFETSNVWQNVLKECQRIFKRAEISSRSHYEAQVRTAHDWSYIVEEFLKYDADPKVNRNSPIGCCIREAFGDLVTERARELQKLLTRVQRRWRFQGKFLVPYLTRSTPTQWRRQSSEPWTIRGWDSVH